MTTAKPDALNPLLLAVRESAKYRHVCAETITRIGQRELGKGRSVKEAIKETKNALHQIAGAYQDHRPPYAEWLAALARAKGEGESAFREACRPFLSRHASTRERMEALDSFFAKVFSDIAPVRSVLDVGCGLNPLCALWMPLAPDAEYLALDLYEDMADFLNGFFALSGVRGAARAQDVLVSPPTEKAQVALILKVLPVLEQWDREAGLRLLRALSADYLLVSFPTRSLGGRGKGMAENYESRFLALIQEEGWTLQRYLFPRELCFLIAKGS